MADFFKRGGKQSTQYGLPASLYLAEDQAITSVKPGTPVVFTNDDDYEVRAAGAGEEFHAIAEVVPHPERRDFSAHIFGGYSRIERLTYSGDTAPTLGGSVSPDGNGAFVPAAADAGQGRVVLVDASAKKFEVLL